MLSPVHLEQGRGPHAVDVNLAGAVDHCFDVPANAIRNDHGPAHLRQDHDADGGWSVARTGDDEHSAVFLWKGNVPSEPARVDGEGTVIVDGSRGRQTWTNVERGTEHTLEIWSAREDGSVREELAIVGLAPALLDEQTILLLDADGSERLRYAGLYVFDAWHRAQTAWFDVVGSEIHIHIEPDDDAVWPLLVDPLLTAPLVINPPSTNPDLDDFNRFGDGVAVGDVSGDGRTDLLVGLPFSEDANDPANAAKGGFTTYRSLSVGADLVFTDFRNINPPGGSNFFDAMCGTSIAIGDVVGGPETDVIVGCPGAEGEDGAILVYQDGIPLNPTFVLRDATPGTNEGTRLADTGGLIVANVNDSTKLEIIATKRDRLFVYDLTASQTPVQVGTTFTASLEPRLAKLSVNPGTDFRDDVAVGITTGARIHLGSVTGLLATFTAITASSGGIFGARVAGADLNADGDDELVIGQPDVSSGAGAVRLFTNNAGVFDTANPLVYSGAASEHMGSEVLGANLNDDRHEDVVYCGQGAVSTNARCVVFGGRPGGVLVALERLSVSHPSANGLATTPIIAGDFRSDGAEDLVLPQPRFNNNFIGRLHVHDGQRATLKSPAFVDPEGNLASLKIGADAIVLADVDSDGFDDLIVSAAPFKSGTSTVGRVLLYRGGATMDEVADWVVTGNTTVTGFGRSIAVGRFRGYSQPPSIAILAAGSNRVFLFHAGTNSLPPGGTNAQLSDAGQNLLVTIGGDETASMIANVGNLINNTGDGIGFGGPGKTTPGSVYLFGSAGIGGLVTTPSATLLGTEVGINCPSSFGTHLADAGNVDGIVRTELLVGGPQCGTDEEGRAFLYLSNVSASFVFPTPAWAFESNEAGAQLGVVAGIGDTDGDGAPDFAVGAPNMDTAAANGGRVYFFRGRFNGDIPLTTQTMSLSLSTANSFFGSAIAGRRDFNRDGLADVVIGAPGWSNNTSTPGEGRLEFFRGRTAGGVETSFASSPIQSNCSNCALGSTVAMGQADQSPVFTDQYGDAAYSVPGFDGGLTDEGLVAVRVGIW